MLLSQSDCGSVTCTCPGRVSVNNPGWMRGSNRKGEFGLTRHNVGEDEDTAAGVEKLLRLSLGWNPSRNPVP
jgi:hypothetical protein